MRTSRLDRVVPHPVLLETATHPRGEIELGNSGLKADGSPVKGKVIVFADMCSHHTSPGGGSIYFSARNDSALEHASSFGPAVQRRPRTAGVRTRVHI